METAFRSTSYKGQELSSYWEIVSCSEFTISPEYPEDIKTTPFYDDGFGQIYIYQTTYGTDGIIRAMSWEEAFEIARDEFCQKVNWNELDDDVKEALEQGEEVDGYEWSPNNGLVDVDYNERLEILGTTQAIQLVTIREIA